jgi:hypothetical protein
MSLAVDLPASARPLPPGRLGKRISSSPSSERPIAVNGVLGGLRERSEDELRAADRDALEAALKAAWAEHDQVGLNPSIEPQQLRGDS